METIKGFRMKKFACRLIFFCMVFRLQAENGHDLRLRKRTAVAVHVVCSGNSPTLTIARQELQEGWQGKKEATIVLAITKDKTIKGDGFRLRADNIVANTEMGILY